MDSTILQFAMFAFGGGLFGFLLAWLIQSVRNKQKIGQLSRAVRAKLAEVAQEKDDFADRHARSQSELQRFEAASKCHGAELEAAVGKSQSLARDLAILRKEREATKKKLGALQNALASLKRQTSGLQTEFDKTREFYKRELLKSLQKRKDLEEEITVARAEQQAFAEAVESSVLEHGSTENMVIAAQLRLGQLNVLERNVKKLEAENAQLRQDAKQLKHDFDARERDLAELEQLRVNNRQLVQAVEALEDSRRQYEDDAERYRQQADDSEKMSDTLRLKLDDLEKNFADIERQQDQVLEDVRQAPVLPILRKQG